jgi:hypothetical protein
MSHPVCDPHCNHLQKNISPGLIVRGSQLTNITYFNTIITTLFFILYIHGAHIKSLINNTILCL